MNTEQLKLENEKLNARLDKAKEVFRQQAADIKAKDAAYLKLRDEYNEVVRERDIHLEANAKFNTQLLKAEAQIEELKTSQGKQEELGDAYNDLKIKNDELTEAVKYWEEKYHKLSEAHSSNSEELHNLKLRHNELEVIATSRLTDINKSKEEIKKLNDTILEMNNNIETLDEKHCKDYNALVLRYDDLQKEYNLLNVQFADLENEYNNSEELRKSYTDATNKLNDEVSRLQDVIVSKDSAYKNLESTYKDLAEEHLRDNRALTYKIETLESEVANKTEKLNKAYEEIGTLKNRLNAESGKVEEVKAKTEVAVTTIKKKLQALNDGLGDDFNIFG